MKMLPILILCFCLLCSAVSGHAIQMEQTAADTKPSCTQACIQHGSMGVSAACTPSGGKDATCYRKGMLELRRRCYAKCAASRLTDALFTKTTALKEANDIFKSEETKETKDLYAETNFMECMATCLNKAVINLIPMHRECGSNKACWGETAGTGGFMCVSQCTPKKAKIKDKTNHVRSNDKWECFAECMGESLEELEEILELCDYDPICLIGAFGASAIPCLFKCGILMTSVMGAQIETLDCNKRCVNNPELNREIPKKCLTDADCWLKEKELLGLKCTAWCNKRTIGSTPQLQDGFLECLAKCMEKSVPEIVEIYAECSLDIDCWLEKVGVIALDCLPQCIGRKEMNNVKATKVQLPQ